MKTKKVANKPEDSESENAIGGMADDDDNRLERDVALSSPMKGAEVRGTAKVRSLFLLQKPDLHRLLVSDKGKSSERHQA